MDDGWRKVEAGACGAWPLPADATCAGVARRLFRRTASALALDREAVDDGETIVSELAANTLHVTCGAHGNGTCSMGRVGTPDGAQARQAGDIADISAPCNPELWLYLRGSGEQCELVCKVFDSYPGWAHGDAPGRGGPQAPTDAMSGRGLEVVHELSHGHWGHHLSRARLGGWNVQGKAVWFTTPAPFAKREPAALGGVIPRQPPGTAGVFAIGGPPRVTSSQAMARLEDKLVARGFGETMVRADDPARDTSVLAVCGELTVWCRAGCVWLRAPGLDGAAWGYGDLVEVAEQVVEAHETFCVDPDFAQGRSARARRR